MWAEGRPPGVQSPSPNCRGARLEPNSPCAETEARTAQSDWGRSVPLQQARVRALSLRRENLQSRPAEMPAAARPAGWRHSSAQAREGLAPARL